MLKRVTVFIDGLNVRHRLRERGWPDMYDVAHLGDQLAGPRDLVEVRFYHPAPNAQQLGASRYAAERAYLEYVGKCQKVVSPPGAYMTWQGRWVEKQTDVLLSADLVYLAAKGAMDIAILATADADICPAVQRAIDFGVPVELMRFKGNRPRIFQLESLSATIHRARPRFFRPPPP
jgi:uncharacterized LabA/DUF88 family protein